MKTRSILIASAACILAAACTKVSDTTVINGSFEANAPDSLEIFVPDNFHLTVHVVDGKFSAEVPANLVELSQIASLGGVNTRFISDGTPLTFTFDGLFQPSSITSKYPKISLQAKKVEYEDALSELPVKYNKLLEELGEEKLDSLYDAYDAEEKAINGSVFDANKDNFLGAASLARMQFSYTVEKLDSLLNVLDPKLAGNSIVEKMRKSVEAKRATQEGKMFTDFEANGVKFSSFIGTGKYMLVDFWASWCGPCKGEIPNIKNVYEKYAGSDFDVLSVAVWDKPQATIDTAKAYNIKWNQIIDAQSVPTDIYGIEGIPHIILFGPDGTILKRELRGEAIEEEIAKYVQAKK